MRVLTILAVASVTLIAQRSDTAPDRLPATAVTQLMTSLDASRAHRQHVWRDTPPLTEDGRVSAYIEIPRGDRRKWEFDMRQNARAIDRMMPESVGGYPVNYGFVPQTVSYDGDPFDVLVLGPALAGGTVVTGRIVGLMQMEDEKGLDSKVVLSPTDASGRNTEPLTEAERKRIGDYFKRYKAHEPGKFSKVPGWGSMADGLSFVKTTHAFFRTCRRDATRPCTIAPPR